jgi:hypothetical protein
MLLFLGFCLRVLACIVGLLGCATLLMATLTYAWWLIPLALGAAIFWAEWKFYQKHGQFFRKG